MANEAQTGEIIQVIGPTVDIRFEGRLPEILNAIHIQNTTSGEQLTVEVAQHLGNNIVRCIGMSSTDGLVRGMKAVDTGKPISVPVGRETLGRMFNMLGTPIDGKGAFRRFKDVLMSYPADRERWFTFRSERLRSCMEGWLDAHAIEVVERPEWRVPATDDASSAAAPLESLDVDASARRGRAAITESNRRRLHQLIDLLPGRELDAAIAFLEFLRERRHMPRATSKNADGTVRESSPSVETELPDDSDDALGE